MESDASLGALTSDSLAAAEIERLSLSATAPKDFSFLLDPAIYHPLSNIDVPPTHRYPTPTPPQPDTPIHLILTDIDILLKQCHFLSAANLAAAALTGGLVQPTDSTSIFHLLSIRYSALELSGNVLLAAQETKALEDLSSSFYYEEVSLPTDGSNPTRGRTSFSRHIMPFDLRLQALRLQGIGFGDARRAVGALFDLGLECRESISRVSASDRSVWEERLEEVGIRVVNALVALGDLDCAKRTLESIKPRDPSSLAAFTARKVLLLIKMGEIDEAQKLLQNHNTASADQIVLQSLITIANADFEGAAELLRDLKGEKSNPAAYAIAKQNLAVIYLYTGRIDKAREIMEGLVDEGLSFQALTVNLATLYDLTSEKSQTLKEALTQKVADIKPTQPRRGYVNADFKL